MQALTDYSKQKRYDKYTLLKGSRFAYKNNASDREHYIGILSDITGNDISSLTEKSDDELESISEAYEEKRLFGCITDFFQNSGYRFRKKLRTEGQVKADPIKAVRRGIRQGRSEIHQKAGRLYKRS